MSDAGKLHYIGLSDAHCHYTVVEKQTVVEVEEEPVEE